MREERIDCGWERVAAYTYAADDSQVDAVKQEAEAARSAGLDADCTTQVALPFSVPLAVCLQRQGQLDPVRYVRGLAAAVQGDGSQIARPGRGRGGPPRRSARSPRRRRRRGGQVRPRASSWRP